MTTASNEAKPGTVDMKLEVVVIPVSGVDRAKRFYENLGWRLDADFVRADGSRAVQLTPPDSPASNQLGTGAFDFRAHILIARGGWLSQGCRAYVTSKAQPASLRSGQHAALLTASW